MYIGQALQDNKTLEVLDVSWNGFGNEGGRALGRALMFNKALVRLDVSCNRINLEGAMAIAEGLRHNRSLHVLKLNRNPITTVGACRIMQVYHSSPKSVLKEFHIQDVVVSPDFEDIVDLLENRGLMVVHGGHVSNADPYATRRKKKKTVLGDPLSLLMEYVKQNSLRLWDMFTQLDKDNSNTVSRKEFLTGMKEAQVPLSEDQIEKLMDKLDADKDGEISFEELLDGQKIYRDRERRKKAALLLPDLARQTVHSVSYYSSRQQPDPRLRSAIHVSMITPLGPPIDNLELHLPSIRNQMKPATPPVVEESNTFVTKQTRKLAW